MTHCIQDYYGSAAGVAQTRQAGDLATFAGYKSAKAVDAGEATGLSLLNKMQYRPYRLIP